MHQPVAVGSVFSEREATPSVSVAMLWNLRPTARESQVLLLICDGYTSKEIAFRLGISFKTVSCHRANLMEKAGVHSSIALFRWALINRFVSFDLEKEKSRLERLDSAKAVGFEIIG